MSVQRHRTADAQLTVRVPREAPGDLAAGAETQLRRVDAVEAVDDLEVRGLEPGLNDLTVEVAARLRVRAPDGDAARRRLSEGFGVTCEAVRLDPPDD